MKRRQGDRWARAVLDGSCGLRRRTGEPYMPLEEEHDGRYQMRDSRCVRRELRLCCTGRESPVRRRVHSMTPTTDGGLTLRPKGAVGMLHRKGSPVRCWKSKETRLMEGLSLRPKGAAALLHRRGESSYRARFDTSEEGLPLQPKGASGSAAPGVGAPSATERAAQLEMTDGGITLRPKGAVGLLHRKGSPVRCWISKETRLMEGLSLRPKGACGSSAPEGRVPLAAEYEVRFFFFFFKRLATNLATFGKTLATFQMWPVLSCEHEILSYTSPCVCSDRWALAPAERSSTFQWPHGSWHRCQWAAHVHTVLPRTNHLPASPLFEIKIFNLTVFFFFPFFFFLLLMHLYYSLSQSFSSFQFLNSSKIAYWAMSERLYVIVLTRTQQ